MKVLHKGVTQGESLDGSEKEPKVPALPTNLVRVGSTYKYRSRIPTDLLPFCAPKREITELLRTKSLTEARRPLPAVQLKYHQEWADLRAALNAKRRFERGLPISAIHGSCMSSTFP